MHQANPWDTRESGTAPAGARAGVHFMCPGLGKDKAASYAGSAKRMYSENDILYSVAYGS